MTRHHPVHQTDSVTDEIVTDVDKEGLRTRQTPKRSPLKAPRAVLEIAVLWSVFAAGRKGTTPVDAQ